MTARQLFAASMAIMTAGFSSTVISQGVPQQPGKGPGSLSGVWRLDGYVSTRKPAAERLVRDDTGSLPPMLPWAKALYEKRILGSDNNKPFASSTAYCLPSGMPQMMRSANYPIQVLETPKQVTMIFEEQHAFRLIYLDQKHPDDVDPGYFGNSVGHWEGETLVVDTVGLNDRLTLDILGMPQSDAMHVGERIRRIAPDKIENILTIDDSKVFSRPWKMRRTYTLYPKERVREDICENNRNAPEGGTTTFLRASPGAKDAQ